MTPRLATNQNKQITWRWEGEAFGETDAKEDPDGDGNTTTINLRFPGQYYDSETGLHYNWHRNYNPQTGRYRQSDLIGLAGGMNTYGYAYQNSLMYVDPMGLAVYRYPGNNYSDRGGAEGCMQPIYIGEYIVGWKPCDDPNDCPPSPNNPSGSNPSGNNPSGNNPSGNNPSGNNPSGNNPSGNNPSGNNPSGNNPSGNNPSGNNPSGNNPSGNNPSGNNPSGNNPSGNNPSGNNPSGNNPSGNNPSGNNPSGNNPSGNNPSGSNPSGNNPSGSNPSGSNPDNTSSPMSCVKGQLGYCQCRNAIDLARCAFRPACQIRARHRLNACVASLGESYGVGDLLLLNNKGRLYRLILLIIGLVFLYYFLDFWGLILFYIIALAMKGVFLNVGGLGFAMFLVGYHMVFGLGYLLIGCALIFLGGVLCDKAKKIGEWVEDFRRLISYIASVVFWRE